MVNAKRYKIWILLHCGSLVNEKNNLDGNGISEGSTNGQKTG